MEPVLIPNHPLHIYHLLGSTRMSALRLQRPVVVQPDQLLLHPNLHLELAELAMLRLGVEAEVVEVAVEEPEAVYPHHLVPL